MVSTRVAVLPESELVSESWTSDTRDAEPVRNGWFEPLVMLVNWRQSGKILVNITGRTPLTVISLSQLRP